MFRNHWRTIALFILFLVLWEAIVILASVPVWLLPAPSIVLHELIYDWPAYSGHIYSTIILSLSGFGIGAVVGLFVSIILHLLPKSRETLYPFIILTQNIPIIVLAPLLVIWFGFGMLPKLIMIALVCFFPIAITVLDAFRQTDHELIHYMKMSGASKRQIFTKLEWPHAIPAIFSSLKIAATYSVMGAVITEWLGAKKGIGVYMTLASSSFRTANVFVAIVLIMVISLTLFSFIQLAEKHFTKWQLTRKETNHG